MYLVNYSYINFLLDLPVEVFDAVLLSKKPSKKVLHAVLLSVLKRDFTGHDIQFHARCLDGVYRDAFESFAYLDFSVGNQRFTFKVCVRKADVVDVDLLDRSLV